MFEFFRHHLALTKTEDFRAIAWVPSHYVEEKVPMQMAHISVAVAYNAFIGYTCCMHTVIQNPDHVSPAMVREAFRYPFEELGMKVIFGLVDSDNEKAIEFDTKLGFKEVNRFKDAGLDGDLILFAMKKEDCRWLRMKHGKEISAPRA